MPQPTLRDLARLAGVSTTTASDAAAGTGRMSEETRSRVVRIAAEIGYVGNTAARRLRRAETGVIGLYLQPDATDLDYFKVLVMSAFHAAGRAGYDLILIGPRDLTDRSLPGRVDGVIISDPFHGGDPDMVRLFSSGLPIVTIEEPDPALPAPVGVVAADHKQAVRAMLDAFWRGGSLRPAYLMTESTWRSQWALELTQAYEEWCGAHALEPIIEEIGMGAGIEEIDSTVSAMLDAHPDIDALFCARDGLAARVAGLVAERGRRVGHDFALATGDDVPMLPYFVPPIAAIDLDPSGYAEQAIELLVRVLTGRADPGARETHTVVFRERASVRLQGRARSA